MPNPVFRDAAATAMRSRPRGGRLGFSLMELMASVTIIGVLAAIGIARMVTPITNANVNACHAHKGEIELQAQLWRRNKGSFPAANLGDIAIDAAYFPEGLPTCPVDGTAYTIDAATGLVVGHTH
ncbi:MAG: prepilin-type N-terminal cleavage/methylation domain-containing protein [Planctomycetota bacterium]